MSLRQQRFIRITFFTGLFALMIICGRWTGRSEAVMPGPDDAEEKSVDIDVLFSPKGGCIERMVKEIESAESRVLVQAYIFTSKEISNAMVAAKKRGVEVEIVIDKSQEKQKYGRLPILRRGGVKIFIDGEHATANNKIILIDKSTIITGSFNYTKAAEEKNSENVLFIKGDKDLFKKYLKNYEQHRDHAKKYEGS